MSDAKRYGCFSWEGGSGEGGQVSEIRRYSCDIDWAAKDGDLVRYSDYTALEAENRKLREALRDVLSWAGKDKKKLTRRGWTLEKEIRSLNRAAEALIDGDERKEGK